VRYERGPTGDQAVFDESELRALMAKIDAKRAPRGAVSIDSPASPENEPRSLARVADYAPLIAVLERLKIAPADNHAAPPVPLGDKLMLTARATAAYSGLPLAEIRAAREQLKTAKHGRGLKLKREVLEAWVRKL